MQETISLEGPAVESMKETEPASGHQNRVASVAPTSRHTIESELDETGLGLIACGHSAFQLLWAGAELKLFTWLSRHPRSTRMEIGNALNLEKHPLRVLLQGLVALRIIKKDDDRYINSAIAERKLVQDREGNALAVLGWQRHIVYPGLMDFTASLRANRNVGLRRFPGKGKTLYERLRSDPKKERVFQDAMSSLSGQANKALAAQLDLEGVRCLLDIGGGDGSNAINLVRSHPNLQALVFDSESVTAHARNNIAASKLQHQIETVTGDCFQDSFPKGADAILLAHLMTIWSAQKNQVLLKKCYAHLPAGGRLILFNMAGTEQDGQRLISALGSPYFQAIATGEGMLYPLEDLQSWLQEAGFRRITLQHLPLEHVAFTAWKE